MNIVLSVCFLGLKCLFAFFSLNLCEICEICSMGRKKVMMQPPLAGFMKRPRVEDNSHEPVVEILDVPVKEISHEPVVSCNSFQGKVDLNVLIEEDFYETEPSFLDEESRDPQPIFLGEGFNHVTEEHEQLHMSMLDRLASGGDEENDLITKERGFREQWKLQFLWIRPITMNGLTHVKCIYYERFQLKSHLGKGEGSRNLQK